jgi:hypothetical protein
MKQFFIITISAMLLSACVGTVVNIEVQNNVKTPNGFISESRQHAFARETYAFFRSRWGNQGVRLHSVSNMLSAYMNTSMWCFEDFIKNIRVAKCTTKRHMDTVSPSKNIYFRYVYAPDARSAGIAIPVFIDDCYLCWSRQW